MMEMTWKNKFQFFYRGTAVKTAKRFIPLCECWVDIWSQLDAMMCVLNPLDYHGFAWIIMDVYV